MSGVTAPASVLDDLEARGLVHDSTDRAALASLLAGGPVSIYYGCDPTSDSLHIGNLIGLLVLRRLQDAGHRPVALAGGATGMVGDPSGRSEERNLLDDATLTANVAAIKAQMARVLDFDDGRALLVDNRDWTAEVTLVDFLRDVGKHVTVNQMLARESVKARLGGEHGISYTEFSYMLLQAHDYLHLHRTLGVAMQIGGSDQWGNIVAGIDLIRRVTGDAAHGLSWPLLTAPDGSKLGKSTGTRIGLNPAHTSPYQFFQHFMQTDDRQVREYLAKFTLLPLDAIDAVAADHASHPERRAGQRRLAEEVTRLVHGPDAMAAAAEATDVLFGASPLAAGAGGAGGRGGGGAHGAAAVGGRAGGGRRRRPPVGGVGPGVVQGRRPPVAGAGGGVGQRRAGGPGGGGRRRRGAPRALRPAAQGEAELRAAGRGKPGGAGTDVTGAALQNVAPSRAASLALAVSQEIPWKHAAQVDALRVAR